MNTKEAIAERLNELSKKHKMAINAVAVSAGITPSTIYSMLNTKSNNPGIVTIKKICDGFGISLREFFNCEMFEEIEQEIR